MGAWEAADWEHEIELLSALKKKKNNDNNGNNNNNNAAAAAGSNNKSPKWVARINTMLCHNGFSPILASSMMSLTTDFEESLYTTLIDVIYNYERRERLVQVHTKFLHNFCPLFNNLSPTVML
jgi:hypothetical protein